MSNPERVVIIVEGGVIQTIACTSKDVLFQICDWDSLEGGPDSLEFKDYVGDPRQANVTGESGVNKVIREIKSQLNKEKKLRKEYGG